MSASRPEAAPPRSAGAGGPEPAQGGAGAGQPRVLVAAAGTAGHVGPAIAVAQALRRRGAIVSFIGGHRAEAELVPAAGFPLRQIAVEGISRRNPALAARALARALRGTIAARKLMRGQRPAVLYGGGGYIVAPAGLAARSLGIPIVLSEADSHLGLANRLLERWAAAICLSFPIDGRSGGRYRLTGRPLPAAGVERTLARRHFAIPPEARCVLVFGGSLGARSINEAAIEALSGGELHVLHVTGRRDFPALKARGARDGYDLREYLDAEQFALALSAADLVVARAGSSVLELAAHGLPMILVPYPHAAGDHQAKNAEIMRAAGAAIVIEDRLLNGERLAASVDELLGDQRRLRAMAAAARALGRADAAERIAELLLEVAG